MSDQTPRTRAEQLIATAENRTTAVAAAILDVADAIRESNLAPLVEHEMREVTPDEPIEAGGFTSYPRTEAILAERRTDAEVIDSLTQQIAALTADANRLRDERDQALSDANEQAGGDWVLLHIDGPTTGVFGPFRTADAAVTWATNQPHDGRWLPVRITKAGA